MRLYNITDFLLIVSSMMLGGIIGIIISLIVYETMVKNKKK